MSHPLQQSTSPLRVIQNFYYPKNNEINFSELSLLDKLKTLNEYTKYSIVDFPDFYEKLILVLDCIANEFFFLNRDNKINFFESILVFMNISKSSKTNVDFNSILNNENVSLLFQENLVYFREKNKAGFFQTLFKPIFTNTVKNWDMKLIEHVQILQNDLKKTLEVSKKNSVHNYNNSPLYLLSVDLYCGCIFSLLDLKSLLNFGKSSYYFSRVVDCFLISVPQYRALKLNFKQLFREDLELMEFFLNVNFFNGFNYFDRSISIVNEIQSNSQEIVVKSIDALDPQIIGNKKLIGELSEKIKKYEEIFGTFVAMYDFLGDSTKLQAWLFATHCVDKLIGYSGGRRKIGCSINDCLGLFIPFILQREFGFKSKESNPKKNANSFLKAEHITNFISILAPYIEKCERLTIKPWLLPFYQAKEGENIYPNFPVFNNPAAFSEYSSFLEKILLADLTNN